MARRPDSVYSRSWASGTTDLNLDGRVDLVVVNGGFVGRSVVNKVPDTDIVVSDPPAVFLGIGGGRYADVWENLGSPWRGTVRCAYAAADLSVGAGPVRPCAAAIATFHRMPIR